MKDYKIAPRYEAEKEIKKWNGYIRVSIGYREPDDFIALLKKGHVMVQILFDKEKKVITELKSYINDQPDEVMGGYKGTRKYLKRERVFCETIRPRYAWHETSEYTGAATTDIEIQSRIFEILSFSKGEVTVPEHALENEHERYLLYCSKEKGDAEDFKGALGLDFIREWMKEQGYYIERRRMHPGYFDIREDAVRRLREGKENRCEALFRVVRNLLLLWEKVRTNGNAWFAHVTGSYPEEPEQELRELNKELGCGQKEAGFLRSLLFVIQDVEESPAWAAEALTEKYTDYMGWKWEEETGTPAMCMYLYIRGIWMIREGAGREELKLFCRSLIPYGWREQYDGMMEEIEKAEESQKQKEIQDKFIQVTKSPRKWRNPEARGTVAALDRRILEMGIEELQRIVMQDIDSRTLVTCMYGLCQEACEKLIDNSSERYQKFLLETLYESAKPKEAEICREAERVLAWIQGWKEGEEE